MTGAIKAQPFPDAETGFPTASNGANFSAIRVSAVVLQPMVSEASATSTKSVINRATTNDLTSRSTSFARSGNDNY